jgi:hypothetical protein
MANVFQDVMNKAPATVQAGGLWDSINGGLNDALNMWGKVEQIKGVNASTGRDIIQARVSPELANGAAVTVDQAIVSPSFQVGGVKMNKNIIYATGGLLLAMLAYKKIS